MIARLAGVRPEWLLLGVGVGVALLLWNRASKGGIVAPVAEAVGQIPLDVFYGGVDGLTGGALPDPRKDSTKAACEDAKARGDCWEVSFVCPALDYLRCLNEKYL